MSSNAPKRCGPNTNQLGTGGVGVARGRGMAARVCRGVGGGRVPEHYRSSNVTLHHSGALWARLQRVQRSHTSTTDKGGPVGEGGERGLVVPSRAVRWVRACVRKTATVSTKITYPWSASSQREINSFVRPFGYKNVCSGCRPTSSGFEFPAQL